MKIEVKVIANSKISKIEKIDGLYKVWLPTRPIEGKANRELIKLLSDFFGVAQKDVIILWGEKNSRKIIEIIDHGVTK